MSGPRPKSVTVRMYQVGFGDCFLVSFRYARKVDGRDQRHVLIDFGSTHRPKGQRKDSPSVTLRAAKHIKDVAGELDAVVVTHRHRDHLSGFADEEAQPIIESLKPKLIVRPWTDDPALPHDATAPLPDPGRNPRAHLSLRLASGQMLAQRIAELAAGADSEPERTDTTRGRLAHLALDQVANKPAIDFLDHLARTSALKPDYLNAGADTALTEVVPGIGVDVLGPPTHDQFPDVLKQRANDPNEFWLKQLVEMGKLDPARIDTRLHAPPPDANVPLGPRAWIVRKLAHQQLASLMRIVRTVDDALNNTSLILLIDAGDRRMLFPGDAQIENWSWSLADEKHRRRLSEVDLYKVGHHGSRNATPKSLFALWNTDETRDRPMAALMSTMPKVHGRSDATAVPRGPLVEALTARMGDRFLRTDEHSEAAGYISVSAPCSGKHPFERDPV